MRCIVMRVVDEVLVFLSKHCAPEDGKIIALFKVILVKKKDFLFNANVILYVLCLFAHCAKKGCNFVLQRVY